MIKTTIKVTAVIDRSRNIKVREYNHLSSQQQAFSNHQTMRALANDDIVNEQLRV